MAKETITRNWAGWCISIIPALWKEEDHKLEGSLGYIVSSRPG
jgi:hypothetical protein